MGGIIKYPLCSGSWNGKTTSELSGKISKNLQRTWEMKACPECVPEALALLTFETQSDNSQGEWEKSAVAMKGLSPQEKWGTFPVLTDCKEMLGLNSSSC